MKNFQRRVDEPQSLATIAPDGKNVCAYCGYHFEVTARHQADNLHRYCSHGCRLQVELPMRSSGTEEATESLIEATASPVDEPIESQRSGSQATYMLSIVFLDDPVSFCILLYGSLCKWRHPVTHAKMSQQEIGNQLGAMFKHTYTRAAISKRMMELVRKYPGLSRWMYHAEKRRA